MCSAGNYQQHDNVARNNNNNNSGGGGSFVDLIPRLNNHDLMDVYNSQRMRGAMAQAGRGGGASSYLLNGGDLLLNSGNMSSPNVATMVKQSPRDLGKSISFTDFL